MESLRDSTRLLTDRPLLSAALLLLLSLLSLHYLRPRHAPYPPGPSLLSIVRRMREPFPWKVMHHHVIVPYGPLSSFSFGLRRVVLVGNYKIANDLLEKMAAVTSDRPQSVMAGEVMSGGMRILFTGYGDRWRRLRKMVHYGLQPNTAKSYEPLQESTSRRAILGMAKEPEEFRNHIRNYAASFIMQVTYGTDSEKTNWYDPEVVMINSLITRVLGEARPGKHLVNTFPFLKHFPGRWKKIGKAWHKEELEFFTKQMDGVKKLIKDGESANCFGRYVIEHQEEVGLNDSESAYVAGAMFGAGSDTTTSAIATAIMAMTVYPEVTKVAQEEMDRVVGRDRVPTFTDEQDLPYLQAFIKEVHRWRPVVPTGAAHATTEDVNYNNYFIPKGSIIIGNHWSISRDPDVFDDVEAFKPERWFVDQKVGGVLRKDVDHVSYGFGRRVCPGRHVADRSVFINYALLLWTFNFAHKRDSKGEKIPIDVDGFTNAGLAHPLPFEVDLMVREGAREILEQS